MAARSVSLASSSSRVKTASLDHNLTVPSRAWLTSSASSGVKLNDSSAAECNCSTRTRRRVMRLQMHTMPDALLQHVSDCVMPNGGMALVP